MHLSEKDRTDILDDICNLGSPAISWRNLDLHRSHHRMFSVVNYYFHILYSQITGTRNHFAP